MTDSIVDVTLSSAAYAIPASRELTNAETMLVIAFFASLTLIVGITIVWTCFHRIVYRVVFGIMYAVGLIAAWILSGFVVSILLFYVKPTS